MRPFVCSSPRFIPQNNRSKHEVIQATRRAGDGAGTRCRRVRRPGGFLRGELPGPQGRRDEAGPGRSGPCTFSQRQGYIDIDLRNGMTYSLSPANKADHFKDQKGNKVVRTQAGVCTELRSSGDVLPARPAPRAP